MLRFGNLMRDGLTEAGVEARLIQPAPILGGARWQPAILRKWLGYVDKFLIFPWVLRQELRDAEFVHLLDHSNAMYVPWFKHLPHLVTCHDLIAIKSAHGKTPEFKTSLTGRILQSWILRGLKQASAIVAISEATAAEVREWVARDRQSVAVVHNSLSREFAAIDRELALKILERHGFTNRLREPYLLHIGSGHVRKNRAAVLRAASVAGWNGPIVLAGAAMESELKELVAGLGLGRQVIEIVKPEDSAVNALYSAAHALIFPSRYEGFGWPLIEAQASGCPVVCSDIPPFRELVRGSALMADPEDHVALGRHVTTLARDVSARAALIEAGLANAVKFSRRAMIEGYLRCIDGAAPIASITRSA